MMNLGFYNLVFWSSARNGIRTILVAGCILLALMFLTSCAVNPATGSANLVLMSENKEKEKIVSFIMPMTAVVKILKVN